MKKIFLIGLLSAFCLSLFAEGLSTEIIKKLNNNVYEVVVKKNKEDSLTYEKELPFDKLSYKERTDEYNSIGTAFYMQDGNFYTAFHVFDFYRYTQNSDYFIRGADGKVYPVDMVLKFSSNRDFVEFSVKGFSGNKAGALKFEKSVEVNTAVYSVGNAQGEGIIIRDGLLTSQTPEARDGEWNWLRFSAAANPGNSGGPLINAEGDVIGIIVRKNSTENLNYALPVAELENVPNNKGIIHERLRYVLPNIQSERYTYDLDGELTLPKNFADTRKFATDINVKLSKEAVATLSKTYSLKGEKSFGKDPDGDLLNGRFSPPFPYLIARLDNGKWDAFSPNNLQDFKLDDNGYVNQGSIAGLSVAFIKKGDKETVESMIKSPKKIMDSILKGSGISRGMAGEQIKISSFGKPISSTTHVDGMGRTWLVNSWKIEFCDYMVLSYTLPLPDGMYVMYKSTETNDILNGFNYDIPFCCDFIIPSYSAKFNEWKEYLDLPQDVYPRHKILEGASFSYDSKSMDFSFGDFKVNLPSSVFSVCDEDSFELGVSYFADEENGVGSNITNIAFEIGENKPNHYLALVYRTKKPSNNAAKEFKDGWKLMKDKVSPYNLEPMEKNNNTIIFGVLSQTEDYIDCGAVIHVGSHKKTIKKLYQKVMKCFGY